MVVLATRSENTFFAVKNHMTFFLIQCRCSCFEIIKNNILSDTKMNASSFYG